MTLLVHLHWYLGIDPPSQELTLHMIQLKKSDINVSINIL
jgi:hypothetical protein